MPKDIAQLIIATSIASSTMTVAYQPINPLGLPFACYIVSITNASTEDVLISIDGTNPHEYAITDQRIYLYAQNMSGPNNQKCYWPKGTVFYVSGTAGTGNVYLTASYNPD